MGDDLGKLGRYALRVRLGGGPLGDTYVAEAEGAAGVIKRGCLKRIHPELTRDRETVKALVREVRRSMSLVHGNVVQVFDIGQDGAYLFLVAELVDGPAVDRVLERLADQGLPFPLPVAVHLVASVCAGLHHAHALDGPSGHGLVHGRVSPHTVLLTYGGEVKVVDFGLESALSSDTLSEALRAYVAPEQLAGAPPDPRSDVYAAGALLYRLLAGRPPPVAEGAAALVQEALAPLTSLRPEVDPELGAIVAGAMAPRPEDRWPTAAQLGQALSTWANAHGQTGAEGELGLLVRHLFSRELVDTGRSPDVPKAYARALRRSAGGAAWGRRLAGLGGAALLLLAGGGAALWGAMGSSQEDWLVTIRSVPPEARIFVDEVDSGLETDAVLEGLDPRRPHRIRLVKEGFAGAQGVLVPGRPELALQLEPLPPAGEVRVASTAPAPPPRRRSATGIERLEDGSARLTAPARAFQLTDAQVPAVWFELDPRSRHEITSRFSVTTRFMRKVRKVGWLARRGDGTLLASGFVSEQHPASLPPGTARVGVFGMDTSLDDPQGRITVEVTSGARRVASGTVHSRGNFIALEDTGLPSLGSLEDERSYRVVHEGGPGTPTLFFVGTGQSLSTLSTERDHMMHLVEPGGRSVVNFARKVWLFTVDETQEDQTVSVLFEPLAIGRLVPTQ